MRINKYIANSGICSRRQADELVKNGKVRVNGSVQNQPGYDISDTDEVMVDGKTISPQSKKLYFLLNKPRGFITTTSDDRSRPTVLDLFTDIDDRIFPVGRLDEDTTGALILTNDGDFSHRVARPAHHIKKTYRARVSGEFSKKRENLLKNGIDIGGYTTKPAEVKLIRQMPTSAIVEITITEGKNRQVRKMFASVGNKVLDLERVAVGSVYLRGLKQGHYRKLTQKELDGLRE